MPRANPAPKVRQCHWLSLDRWREIDERQPAPIFTARPAWSLAWADSFPGTEAAPIRCEFADGSSVYVPTLRCRTRLGWNVCRGMPWGEYTMFLHEDGREARPDIAAAAARAIMRSLCAAWELTLWPLGCTPQLDLPAQCKIGEIAAIDLAGGAEGAIAHMDSRARRNAGQAERRGVICRCSTEHAAADVYYDLLEASAKRWGLEQPTIPKRLLQNVVRYGGNDVEIWFALFEGRAIAGAVVLFGLQEMNFWTAAMRAEYSTLRPNNALNVALLKRAAARGVRWYNLCSSSGLAGVERFKDSLGAQRVRCTTMTLERGTYTAYRKARSILGRKVLHRPESLDWRGTG